MGVSHALETLGGNARDLGMSFESDVLSCISNQSQRSTRGDSVSGCGSTSVSALSNNGNGGGMGPDTISPFSSFMDSESFADLEVGSDEEPDAKLCAMGIPTIILWGKKQMFYPKLPISPLQISRLLKDQVEEAFHSNTEEVSAIATCPMQRA